MKNKRTPNSVIPDKILSEPLAYPQCTPKTAEFSVSGVSEEPENAQKISVPPQTCNDSATILENCEAMERKLVAANKVKASRAKVAAMSLLKDKNVQAVIIKYATDRSHPVKPVVLTLISVAQGFDMGQAANRDDIKSIAHPDMRGKFLLTEMMPLLDLIGFTVQESERSRRYSELFELRVRRETSVKLQAISLLAADTLLSKIGHPSDTLRHPGLYTELDKNGKVIQHPRPKDVPAVREARRKLAEVKELERINYETLKRRQSAQSLGEGKNTYATSGQGNSFMKMLVGIVILIVVVFALSQLNQQDSATGEVTHYKTESSISEYMSQQ